MTKEDIIIEMIKELKTLRLEDRREILEKISSTEVRQSSDKKDILDRQSSDKKEMLDKISSFEANSNLHFSSINNTLAHERIRVDAIYEERKNVGIKFSRKMVAANTFFAGFVAFMVSFFVK